MCVLGRWGLGGRTCFLVCETLQPTRESRTPGWQSAIAAIPTTRYVSSRPNRRHAPATPSRDICKLGTIVWQGIALGWRAGEGAGAGARRAWTGGRLIGEAGTMREWSLNARPLTTVVAVPLCSSLWLWTCGWSVIPCSAFAKGPRTVVEASTTRGHGEFLRDADAATVACQKSGIYPTFDSAARLG